MSKKSLSLHDIIYKNLKKLLEDSPSQFIDVISPLVPNFDQTASTQKGEIFLLTDDGDAIPLDDIASSIEGLVDVLNILKNNNILSE